MAAVTARSTKGTITIFIMGAGTRVRTNRLPPRPREIGPSCWSDYAEKAPENEFHLCDAITLTIKMYAMTLPIDAKMAEMITTSGGMTVRENSTMTDIFAETPPREVNTPMTDTTRRPRWREGRCVSALVVPALPPRQVHRSLTEPRNF